MENEIPGVRVLIPLALRPLCTPESASRQGAFQFHARSVREVLSELARQQPQVHVKICDEAGDPRRHINVFVNDDHIRARDGLDTRLAAGDVVTILPAVSGG